MATRKNYMMTDSAVEILADQPNASEYLCKIVDHFEALCLNSMIGLFSSGWRKSEILAVCDLLNGIYYQGDVALTSMLPMEMEDADDGLLSKWGITDAEWAECVDRASIETTAYRLWNVAQGYWLGNSMVRRRLGPGGDETGV